MKYKLKNDFFFFSLILLLISFLFINTRFNKELEKIINEYYYLHQDNNIDNNITELELDKYVSNKIINDSIYYYKLSIQNDSEQIIFDYQSKYGCLHIYLNKNFDFNESDYLFCSEGVNSFFILNKSDILEKIGGENETIKDLEIVIGVGYPISEIDKIDYDYELKVSLRKPEINILEINSEHKILCKTEKDSQTNYKCLFVITYNQEKSSNNIEQDKELIIYPMPQRKTLKMNIYSDLIDKEYYNNWNIEYLQNNIPNNYSEYTNVNLEQDYIYIPNIKNSKYFYICIESEEEVIIEMITHIFYKNEEIILPKINEMKIFSFNKSSVSLNFDNIEENELYISLITLNGRANILWEFDPNTKYISNKIENQLSLNLDKESCINNSCNLTINNLEYMVENNVSDYGFIFCISYSSKTDNNKLNEFIYGKSFKLSYNDVKFPLILFSQIPNASLPININLQFYNFSQLNISKIDSNIFNIEVAIFSTEDIYKIIKNPSNFQLKNYITGIFDCALFASNIYLSVNDIEQFEVHKNPWVLIYITINNINSNFNLILGSTISQINSLIYPAENLYHYGKLINEKRTIYRLKSKYHLMRIEIGLNNNEIRWSVNRKHEDINYIYNDTDISFVTEKWCNGRGLVTIYIERGEDIYLNFFSNNSNNQSNYIFKYVNAPTNTQFKNYMVKKDSLSYDNKLIIINQMNNIPNISNINYYLKIIEESDYIENELIKTIAISQSYSKLSIKGNVKNNKIIFPLENIIQENKSYYVNAFSNIIGEDLDIEYLSYNGLILNNKSYDKSNSNKTMIIIICSVGGFILVVLFLIIYCIYKIRRRRHLINLMNQISFQNYLEDEEIESNGYDILLI